MQYFRLRARKHSFCCRFLEYFGVVVATFLFFWGCCLISLFGPVGNNAGNNSDNNAGDNAGNYAGSNAGNNVGTNAGNNAGNNVGNTAGNHFGTKTLTHWHTYTAHCH